MSESLIGRIALRTAFAALVILGACAIVSCASFGGMAEEAAEYDGYLYEEPKMAVAPGAAPAPQAAERSVPMASAATGLMVEADALSDAPTIDGAPEPERPVLRMRVYSADLELVVASVETSRDRIIGLVESGGGYVESSAADYLVVRVPAERFDSMLAEIEDQGDVRSRAVRTADVTEQFQDLERRLQISEASRDRLLNLLEQTEDPDERVAILREIRRLTEEIEHLRSSLESLAQLIRFSRITVRLISRIQLSQISRQEIPFPWIARLDPLGSQTGDASSDIPVVPDDSFAVFESGRRLLAEAADGTQLRAGAIPNQPRGDERFWQAALLHHLKPYYREATAFVAGEFKGVIFESKDAEAFHYLVAVDVRADELIVVEAFFPTDETRETRLSRIRTAMAGGGQ